jgi:hypothetical protein
MFMFWHPHGNTLRRLCILTKLTSQTSHAHHALRFLLLIHCLSLILSFLLCFVGEKDGIDVGDAVVGEKLGIDVGDAGIDINPVGVADEIAEGATEGETEGALLGESEMVGLMVSPFLDPFLLLDFPFLLLGSLLVDFPFWDPNTEGSGLKDGEAVGCSAFFLRLALEPFADDTDGADEIDGL